MSEIICGIYKITNIVNGKLYVGSSTDIHYRWMNHRSLLSRNKHHSIHFQRSVDKHTIAKFKFEIIEHCNVGVLLEREQYYLDTILYAQEFINKIDNRFVKLGYNIQPTAGSNLGFIHSFETLIKIRNSRGLSRICKVRVSDNVILKYYDFLKEASADCDMCRMAIGLNINNNTVPKNKDYYFVRENQYDINNSPIPTKLPKYVKPTFRGDEVSVVVYYRSSKRIFKTFNNYGEIAKYFNVKNTIISSIIHRPDQCVVNCKLQLPDYLFFKLKSNVDKIGFTWSGALLKINNTTGVIDSIYLSVSQCSKIENISRTMVYKYVNRKLIIDNYIYEYATETNTVELNDKDIVYSI